MNSTNAIVFLLVVSAVVGGGLVSCNRAARAPLQVTLRLSVTPAEQMEFVIGQASSAKLKYEVGKKAGVKPAFAQRLALKPVPQSSFLEAQAGVQTRAEGQRFIEAFIEALRAQCGTQAEVVVVQQAIH
jgi:hypothetical protein